MCCFDDKESSSFGDTGSEFNVCASTCHISRDRDGAFLAGVSNDLSFLAVILSVKDVTRDLGAFEHFANQLGGIDRGGSDQDRLATIMCFLDFSDDRVVFFPAGFKYLIVMIDADVRHVGRNGQDVELVDVVEFCSLGLSRSGHAC